MALQSATHAASATRSSIAIPASLDAASGCHLEITNTSAIAVRLGGSDITFASGGKLIAGSGTWKSVYPLAPSDVLYVICDTLGAATLDLLWVNV